MRDRTPPSQQGRNLTLVEKTCVECGEPFRCPAYLAPRYVTCSRECSGVRKRRPFYGTATRTCPECHAPFEAVLTRNGTVRKGQQFCCNPCRLVALQRIPRPKKGKGRGWLDPKGYRHIIVWVHGERRAMLEHRWVMEQHLGRSLSPDEVVHHVNEVRDDNRIENLRVVSSHSDHLLHEHSTRPSGRKHNRWRRDVDDAYIVRRRNEGVSFRAIGRELGISRQVIATHFRRSQQDSVTDAQTTG